MWARYQKHNIQHKNNLQDSYSFQFKEHFTAKYLYSFSFCLSCIFQKFLIIKTIGRFSNLLSVTKKYHKLFFIQWMYRKLPGVTRLELYKVWLAISRGKRDKRIEILMELSIFFCFKFTPLIYSRLIKVTTEG